MSILNSNLEEEFSTNVGCAQCVVISTQYGTGAIMAKQIQEMLSQIDIEDYNATAVKNVVNLVSAKQTYIGEDKPNFQDYNLYPAEAELIFDNLQPQCVDIKVKDFCNEVVARISPVPPVDEEFFRDSKNTITQINNEHLISRAGAIGEYRFYI